MAKVVVVSRADTGREGGGPKGGSYNGRIEAQSILDPDGAPKGHPKEGDPGSTVADTTSYYDNFRTRHTRTGRIHTATGDSAIIVKDASRSHSGAA